MFDPLEGVTADGLIRTGASRGRVPDLFVPVLDSARDLIAAGGPDASLYVYGSVATGWARSPDSDVDLLTIGLASDAADALSATLSHRFTSICRGVEIAVSTPEDFVGEHDEAYGGRVFLHHYCVHLAGVDHDGVGVGFPADARAREVSTATSRVVSGTGKACLIGSTRRCWAVRSRARRCSPWRGW